LSSDATSTSSSSPSSLQGKVMAAASRLVTQDNKLFSFLHWAGDLMAHEVARGGGSSAGEGDSSSKAVFRVVSGNASTICSGSLELALPELLAGRKLVAMCHEPQEAASAPAAAPGLANGNLTSSSSEASSNSNKKGGGGGGGASAGAAPGRVLLCCAYTPVTMASEQLLKEHGLPGCSVMVIWDTRRPSKPEHLLVCEGVITCCCWGVYPCTSFVFAGTEGACSCWGGYSQLALGLP
jgi:hypothetical protein